MCAAVTKTLWEEFKIYEFLVFIRLARCTPWKQRRWHFPMKRVNSVRRNNYVDPIFLFARNYFHMYSCCSEDCFYAHLLCFRVDVSSCLTREENRKYGMIPTAKWHDRQHDEVKNKIHLFSMAASIVASWCESIVKVFIKMMVNWTMPTAFRSIRWTAI